MIRRETAERQVQQDNKGSAIVTVLVVVTFMTILATIMLYVSGSNFQMKTVDYRTKESFYYAEAQVEELRAQLVMDVQVAFTKAYSTASSECGSMMNMQDDHYRQLFLQEMNKIWKARCGTIDDTLNLDWEEGIKRVVTQPGSGSDWTVKVTTKPESQKGFLEGANGQLFFPEVEFTFDSPEGYTSIISTEFCIVVPTVQWPTWDETSNTYKYNSTTAGETDFGAYVNYVNWTKK